MKNLLIVHISDLHIKPADGEIWTAERAKLIARSAVRNTNYECIVLIVSGDTAHAGRKDEFSLGETFLVELVNECGKLGQCETKTLVAPGNHDCDFSKENVLREFSRSKKSKEFLEKPEVLESLIEPLRNFRNFESRVDDLPNIDRFPTHKSATLEIKGKSIQFRVFTSPLYSQIKEVKGDLFLPTNVFEQGWSENCLRIGVMHHPSSWFDQEIARGVRTSLRSNAHLMFYGHEHIPELTELSSDQSHLSQATIEVDGGVLHEHQGSSASSFITLEINLQSDAIRGYSHNWNASNAFFDQTSISNLSRNEGWLKLPIGERSFNVTAAFEDKLSDPGIIAVNQMGRGIKAADLYVHPDLVAPIKGKSSLEEIFSAKILYDINKFQDGVVIQGEEKLGKTSLLFRLFDSLHHQGMVPIYIAMREHKFRASNDFEKALRKSIESVYSNENVDSFAAIPRERRVFLIDDIDVLRTEELRTALISFLKGQSSYFFATTTLKTQLTEAVTQDGEGAVGQIRQIRIDRFNSLKRSELINKWVVEIEEIEDREEILVRVDHLEKGATATLGHNMVPRVPHMLLIFLQSSSATSQSKLESGALAHYYTYLVTQHLLTAGVKRDEIEEHLSFARLISFRMHQLNSLYIDKNELNQCNADFSSRYFPGNLSTRLNVLKNAKLIEEFGSDAYQWRHGYFHYLFLGEYLSKHLQEPGIRDMVNEMCKHLYTRSNANALIFLTHFSKDPAVFSSVVDVIKSLFQDQPPLELGIHTKEFSTAMQEVRDLYIPEGGAVEARKLKHAHDDAHEKKNGDGFLEHQNNGTLSNLEELIVLFKTSEIVGQVLKEQYASIERAVREPIVIALLNAYLRAAGGLIRNIIDNKVLLQKWIEKRISESKDVLTAQEQANEAELFVFEIVQMFMFAFFQKIGDTISSEKTLDLVRNIKYPTDLESKVFILACELNLQRSIPFSSIDVLIKEAGKDGAFLGLVRNLVQRRVTMFHTKMPELQALAERFHIPISHLQAIDFRESRIR